MNEVDKLRQAMGEPPATQFAAVDVDRIMRVGGRRRIRRRLLAGAGVVAAVAVITGGVIGIRLFQGNETTSPVQVAAEPLAAPAIDTGVDDIAGRAVLQVLPGSSPYKYRLVLTNQGSSTPVLATECDATQAGFQGVRAGAPQSRVPLFGCFIGPIRHISASSPGAGLEISLAPQPELKITVFWAAPKALPQADTRVKLVAYDTDEAASGVAEVTVP
jgi:hypothetical protein